MTIFLPIFLSVSPLERGIERDHYFKFRDSNDGFVVELVSLKYWAHCCRKILHSVCVHWGFPCKAHLKERVNFYFCTTLEQTTG